MKRYVYVGKTISIIYDVDEGKLKKKKKQMKKITIGCKVSIHMNYAILFNY